MERSRIVGLSTGFPSSVKTFGAVGFFIVVFVFFLEACSGSSFWGFFLVFSFMGGTAMALGAARRVIPVLVFICFFGLVCYAGESLAPAKTDPSEVRALNSILGRWGLTASPSWNISGNPCTGIAIDGDFESDSFNPAIKCRCSYDNHTTCHITHLKVYSKDVTGRIPEELQNLTYLRNLILTRNFLTGPIPAFIGRLTSIRFLRLGVNSLSGSIPKELGMLRNIRVLSFPSNRFTGPLPSDLGALTRMEILYMNSAGVSGEIPSSFSNLRSLRVIRASNNNFTGRIPDFLGTLTNLESLQIQGNSFHGPVPSTFSNLTSLKDLRIGDLTEGRSSLDFIHNMKNLTTLILRNCRMSGEIPPNIEEYSKLLVLDLSFNNFMGQVPQSLFNLVSLKYLFLGNNNFSGSLPSVKKLSLKNIDVSYNLLSGMLPKWVLEDGLQLNLVSNNFVASDLPDRSMRGLICLQRSWPCYRGSPRYYSWSINSGSDQSMRASDGTLYEADGAGLTTASWFITESRKWAISTVGWFPNADNASYILNSRAQFTGTVDSMLFQTARISPSSIRYYGLGLESGNYTVKLQFAETVFPNTQVWQHNGRRIFDIFIQGVQVAKDFDIKEEAGGIPFSAVVKAYTAPVTENFLEIHLFWSGRGTCCIPRQGYYGPSISAVSVTPLDFKPTVSNQMTGKKMSGRTMTALIVGGVVAIFLSVLAAYMAWIFIRKRRSMLLDDDDFGEMEEKPNIFSYSALKLATNDFDEANKLGEGGFGSVYKGTLEDGMTVAVKKLSPTSQQGKRQFLAEISIISAVQHKNLVKLLGCCIDENCRILVYEYLENNSLEHALFDKKGVHLDWNTRYAICVGTAKGLGYLHEESRLRIVHRDVKPSNILLDADLNPKISDFGLAKLFDEKMTHVTTRLAGTIGYLAPEYALIGHMTEKVDVFAFGILILQILSGRTNKFNDESGRMLYLLQWVWDLRECERVVDMVDPNLQTYDPQEVVRLVDIALLCTQASPAQRPSMSRIVSMLNGDVEVDPVTTPPSYLKAFQFGDHSSTYSSDASTPMLASSSSSAAPSNPHLSSLSSGHATSLRKMDV